MVQKSIQDKFLGKKKLWIDWIYSLDILKVKYWFLAKGIMQCEVIYNKKLSNHLKW